jgi:TRAP-type mannitol/chloroaromatic compound transport system permease small subunit
MRRAVRVIERISRIFGAIAAALVLVLIALMAYEVALRYVFKAPTVWSYDLSTMTMGAVFVLSIGYTLATNAHVRVDILKPLLGRRGPHAIDLAGHAVVMLPLLAWLSWSLWEYFLAAFLSQERSGASAWNPLVWPFRAVMFLGVLVWTLQVAAEIAKLALMLAGRAPGEEQGTPG